MIQKEIIIDPLSLVSLLITVKTNDQVLSTATGFVYSQAGRRFLITNWHVVTGRNPETGKVSSPTGGIPDTIEVIFQDEKGIGKWSKRLFALYRDDGSPIWIEHPAGRRIDVVAIPLDLMPSGYILNPLDASLANEDLVIYPGMSVFIIGFPLGFASHGAFPIWKTGHIASDHDLDYRNLPRFLIDATTRGGMSGSPVVARPSGPYSTAKGGVVLMSSRVPTRFLGVYSGRVHPDSEIGMVWKPEVITQILSTVIPPEK